MIQINKLVMFLLLTSTLHAGKNNKNHPTINKLDNRASLRFSYFSFQHCSNQEQKLPVNEESSKDIEKKLEEIYRREIKWADQKKLFLKNLIDCVDQSVEGLERCCKNSSSFQKRLKEEGIYNPFIELLKAFGEKNYRKRKLMPRLNLVNQKITILCNAGFCVDRHELSDFFESIRKFMKIYIKEGGSFNFENFSITKKLLVKACGLKSLPTHCEFLKGNKSAIDLYLIFYTTFSDFSDEEFIKKLNSCSLEEIQTLLCLTPNMQGELLLWLARSDKVISLEYLRLFIEKSQSAYVYDDKTHNSLPMVVLEPLLLNYREVNPDLIIEKINFLIEQGVDLMAKNKKGEIFGDHLNEVIERKKKLGKKYDKLIEFCRDLQVNHYSSQNIVV